VLGRKIETFSRQNLRAKKWKSQRKAPFRGLQNMQKTPLKEKSSKNSLRMKRLRVFWDDDYILKLIAAF